MLLRSERWLEAHGLELGGAIELDLAELGVRGRGTVTGIEPCPALQEGDPATERIVTGRFLHHRGRPVDLHLDGLDEPIGVTARHAIWSADRQAWVSVGELAPLERVRALGTTMAMTHLTERPGTQAVYNLEVEGQHVYRVSEAGVLVHNQSCPSNLLPRHA